MKRKPSALVLDFGGVLVEIHGREVAKSLSRHLTSEATQKIPGLAHWETHHQYERGLISTGDFCAALAEHLGVPLAVGDFVPAWNKIFGPTVRDIESVLAELSKCLPLYLLSNTNEAHWQHITSTYDFMGHFQHAFTSFELGARKPDQEIYQALLARLGLDGSEVLFIDDLQVNIEGARAAGLMAEACLNSADRLREIAASYGITSK